MIKFKEIKTGRVWYIHNPEHIKHFRHNPRFKEIQEDVIKEAKPKGKAKNITEKIEKNNE